MSKNYILKFDVPVLIFYCIFSVIVSGEQARARLRSLNPGGRGASDVDLFG